MVSIVQWNEESSHFHRIWTKAIFFHGQIKSWQIKKKKWKYEKVVFTAWMLGDMNSMRLSMYCRWMANVLSYQIVPNWRSTSSINLDHRHRSYLFGRQIVWVYRTYPSLDGIRIHRYWSNLASPHLVQPIILHDQIIRRYFATPINSIKRNRFFFLCRVCRKRWKIVLCFMEN